jgi:Domain of unknown function (DUF4288)
MNWYLTKMVYRIICGNGEHKAQYEEQIRIIAAPTAEAALEKGNIIALTEINQVKESGSLVKWQFVTITELYRLHNFIDGAEIFSQHREEENGDLFEQKLHRKAENVRYNLKNRLLEIF